MSTPDWTVVKHLFDAALAQPAAQREAFVRASGAPRERVHVQTDAPAPLP